MQKIKSFVGDHIAAFIGGDETFGNSLRVGITPIDMMEFSVEDCVENWNEIEQKIYDKSHQICIHCGGIATKIDQKWQHDKFSKIRTLKRLTGVCNDCYKICNLGKSISFDEMSVATIEHYCRVTGKNVSQFIGDIMFETKEVQDIDYKWKVDFSFVKIYIKSGVESRIYEKLYNYYDPPRFMK
jgi:hypothetical protein